MARIFGRVFFVLIVAYHFLNGNWLRTLGKGRYPLKRIASTFANFLLLAATTVAAVGSVLVSQTLFDFVDHDGGLFARQFHQATTRVVFLIAAFHCGMYATRFLSKRKNVAARRIVAAAFVLLSLYGIWSSFRHDIGEKLLLRQAYSYWDGSSVIFFFDYFAIFVLYASLGRLLLERLSARSQPKPTETKSKSR